MKILFTGFTSRTIGSDRNVYDYMCNVDVLRRTLELAGHEVDQRPVSITEKDVASRYDCALVGIAAMQGLSSRYKLSGLWTLAQFGERAGIFPSDGKNIYIFPGSVRTCLTGNHGVETPLDYMLGALQKDRNNVIEAEEGGLHDPENGYRDIWRETLEALPHDEKSPKSRWKVLIPTHSWGKARVYERHMGNTVTIWDPTNVAIPMQFHPDTLAPDGRLIDVHEALNASSRKREWILSSLQDQSGWLKKMNPKWPVVVIGNKRSARDGKGLDYVPEQELIENYYTKYWGHLAFGYPLGDGGWWRMRYIHAAMAGIVTIPGELDAMSMPPAYKHSRSLVETYSDERLQKIAAEQYLQLRESAWPTEQTVAVVDGFVRDLGEQHGKLAS